MLPNIVNFLSLWVPQSYKIEQKAEILALCALQGLWPYCPLLSYSLYVKSDKNETITYIVKLLTEGKGMATPSIFFKEHSNFLEFCREGITLG